MVLYLKIILKSQIILINAENVHKNFKIFLKHPPVML